MCLHLPVELRARAQRELRFLTDIDAVLQYVI